MKLSKRGEYALRALIDLGIARELGRPMLQISALVEKEKLPEKFLVQILLQLREAGYIESRRGKHGGYLLASPMEQINFGQVIRLIDGPLAPIACVSQTAYARCTCPDEAHCGLRMLMLDVRNAIANVLDTLADIVGVTLRKLRRDNASFHLDDLFGPLLGNADGDDRELTTIAAGSVPNAALKTKRVRPQGRTENPDQRPGQPVKPGCPAPGKSRTQRSI